MAGPQKCRINPAFLRSCLSAILRFCNSMDLRQLEILQAIAETGSFTACGRKLHVSQSAISRQIALLEEELGEPLFLRVGRQVRMTPAAEADLVTLPVLREELLLVTMPGHPLAKRKKITAQDLAGEPFVLFEAGSGTRRVIDRFFLSENVEPNVVMDTENVEIIKAMVKEGLGIGIVPYMAVAREVRARQFFVTRIEGHELSRETGWVYPRANRTPRMIDELLAAFEKVRGRLPLAAPAKI